MVREIAPRTIVVTEREPFEANVLIAEMDDSALLLVNTPATEASTRELVDWLRARFGPRRLVVINTHFHLDAVGGNALLAEAGVEIHGSVQTAALVRERGAAMRSELVRMYEEKPAIAERLANTRLVPPAQLFEPSAGLTLRFGGESVRVIFPGAAHAPDNVVVHFPARQLVFGGCMVKGGGLTRLPRRRRHGELARRAACHRGASPEAPRAWARSQARRRTARPHAGATRRALR